MADLKRVLTIAGSDSSGGAGIQADLKTMLAHGVYGMSAITALTAQNTMGVTAVLESTPEFLEQQLDAIFSDIYPDAVKIGMVSSVALLDVIDRKLYEYGAEHIVLDPVMVSTSGARLIQEDAEVKLKSIFPNAELITPNIPELEVLSGRTILSAQDQERAAVELSAYCGVAVLAKGGHFTATADDVLATGGKVRWYRGEHIENRNTHGTGCTLSSAIASNLAIGHPLEEAILRAKSYLTEALRFGLDLGKGDGPMHHGYAIQQNRTLPLW